MMLLQKFEIHVSEKSLADLAHRLSNSRWPIQFKDSEWERGFKKEELQSIVEYWKYQYNWRKQEDELNSYSQFLCKVEDVDVHFIYEKGKGPNPIPIILTHGWPDSFLRYKKVINLLTDPARYGASPNDSFDVIVPSIPGFGFSSSPEFSGYNNSRVADIWVKMMTEKLGYTQFAAAGGDLGSGITRYMAQNHPEYLIGIHLTDIGILRPILMEKDDSKLTEEEYNYKIKAQQWITQEGAYMSIQSTKPLTLAYGLSDSPVGVAAWLLEKFHSWSGCNGILESVFSKDELLTNIMIYWLTNTIGSSAHMYYENTHSLAPLSRINVPTGIAFFKRDVLLPPRAWAEKNLNVVHLSEIPRGGHFTAMEEPYLFVEDIRKFYSRFR